jgi:hypothetical protein
MRLRLRGRPRDPEPWVCVGNGVEVFVEVSVNEGRRHRFAKRYEFHHVNGGVEVLVEVVIAR